MAVVRLAKRLTRDATRGARPSATYFLDPARDSACSAIFVVARRVDAVIPRGRRAHDLVRVAGRGAHAVVANHPARTRLPASSAIVRVDLRVEAGLAAFRGPGTAICDARVVETHLSRAACAVARQRRRQVRAARGARKHDEQTRHRRMESANPDRHATIIADHGPLHARSRSLRLQASSARRRRACRRAREWSPPAGLRDLAAPEQAATSAETTTTAEKSVRR